MFGCAAMSEISSESSPMRLVPRDYGRMATSFLLANSRSMLVADPGLGKTSITMNALNLLKLASGRHFPALVWAPKRVAEVVWTGEQQKWDCFRDLSIIKVMGPEDVRRDALKRAVADVYIINYDLAPWLVDTFPQSRWPFRTSIADESSKLKGFRLNKGGVRAKAMSMIAKFTETWWNLTGTPCPNGLIDLWGQMWFVDGGERLKRSFTAFKEAFFIENQWTRELTLQYGAEKAIHDLVADKMLALRAEDWLDIQKPQFIPMEVQLPDAVMQQYKVLERDYFLQLPGGNIKAGTAMVKSVKLLQFCSGSVFDENSVPVHIHDAKLEALDEILEKIAPAPLLVSYWWTADVPRILGYLNARGITCRVYAGQRDEDDWNAGRLRVLLLQQQSAYGLNLAKPCRDICFYSYYWSGEMHQQMLERVGPTRQEQLGKKQIVRVWTIQTLGTIEKDVTDSNEGKISVEQALKRARARRTL